MFTKRSIVAPAILAGLLASACDHESPSAPSPLPVVTPAPPPAIPVVEVWNLTLRLTSVSGGECVGETMQSQIGVPQSYSLTTAQTETSFEVTLKSASGDYDCTFPAIRDSDGFTTVGVRGYFRCESGGLVRGFHCANGMQRDVFSWGQDISGRISGSEISGNLEGTWDVFEAGDLPYDSAVMETTAEYTGRRQ